MDEERPERKEKFLTKAVIQGLTQYGTMKGWPDEVVLYQPHDTEQSLLYEFAECLCVRTLLHTQGLPVRSEFRSNTEFMSPSGEVPLLRVPSPTGESELLVAGFDAIANLLKAKGLLNFDETPDQVADVAYAKESFSMIEEYVSWCHEATLQAVTLPRCGSVYTPPLNWLVPKLKQWRMQNRMKVLGAADKSTTDIIKLMEECCEQLSLRLGSQKFFYSDERASLLDAVVFGHLFTILTTELPEIDLKSIVRRHKNLIDFCQRVEKDCFARRRS